jgi:anti-sigma factor RsiW
MSCPLESRDHTELLMAYAGRKLDAAKAGLVERHMEQCGDCRALVGDQQTLWEALNIWEAEPVSPDFNRRLYRRIDEQGTWRARLLNPWRPVFHKGLPLAATAALVLVAGVMLDRTAAPPPQPADAGSQLAVVEPLQPEQVVEALDEMQELSQFNELMKPENLKSKM